MSRYIIDTTNEDDDALEYLAEQTNQDIEGVIEGMFAMIVEACRGRVI